jgi:hypothetical protein
LTLTQLDGGTLTPTFTDLQGVTALTAGTGLTGGTITTTGTLAADTNLLVTRFDTSAMLLPYLRKADTTNMLLPYFRDADTSQLNLTSRFATKLNISDTTLMLSKYLRRADTSLLNFTSRFATKLNISDTSSMLTNYKNALNTKLNISDTTLMLSKYLRKLDTITLSNRINLKVNLSDTASMLLPYFRDADTTLLNLTSRFAAKQNTLNGTGFVKASGTNITYDNSSYLRTGLADSTYLKLTGGTLTGNLSVNGSSTLRFTNIYDKGTYTPFNVGISEQSILNVGAYLRGGTVMLFPDSNLVSSSANLFLANSNVLGVEYSAFGSGLRNYSKQAGDNRRNSLALYTSDIGQQNTNRIYINYNGDIGINDDTPSYKLDVNGTLGVTGTATLSSTLAVTDAVTLSTTTATPSTLLGKDGSNVVGTVTTLAQTGLMTRGETTATTGSPSAVFTVTHGLGSNPSAVIVTSAGIGGGDKIIFEVYTKSSTTFSVQAWNLDGTEAASKSVKIYWLAIK